MNTEAEGPIVIHPSVKGDPARIGEADQAQTSQSITVIELADAPALPDLPTDDAVLPPAGEEQPRPSAPPRERALGLDAVRGVCILGMNVAFAIPFAVLPAWMYHMQYPPPSGEYANIAGLTWQDILFPGFVFAMAAAIPIRGAQIIAAGTPGARIAWDALKRGALLFLFALIIGHVNSYYTGYYTRTGNLLAIAGFAVCFAIFVRRREDWSPRAFAWVRRVGYAAAALLLFAAPTLWGGSFSFLRRDQIISAIAVTYVLATFVWLLTRTSLRARVAVAVALAVLKLLAPLGGVFGALLGRSFAPALYEPWYIELLLVAIPGLIAGDLLREWMARRDEVPVELAHPKHARSSVGVRPRLLGAAALGLAIPVLLLVGLYQRWLPGTTFATMALVALGAVLLEPLRHTPQRRLAQIGGWAAALLIAGVLLEPLEGGIKKVPQTLSFLVLCAGIWFGVLLSTTVLLDLVRGGVRRLAAPIAVAGQNAMLAYVLFMLFISQVAYLLGIGNALSATPAAAVARGLIATGLVLGTLLIATRNRVVWRA